MIETDGGIACRREQAVGRRAHGKARRGTRQIKIGNHPLPGNGRWHVGITEHRHPVGFQQQCLFDGFGEIDNALAGQAIHQVEIDRLDAGTAELVHGGHDGVEGLDAVDEFLHVRRERLHTQADAVDAGSRQHLGIARLNGARIKFHGDFGAVCHVELGAQRRDNAGQHGRGQSVGTAAAKLHGDHPALHQAGRRGDLGQQRLFIALQPVIGRHLGVAAAIPANLPAERHMEIERHRRTRRDGGERLALLGRAHAFVELRCRGVAGVARHRLRGEIGMKDSHGGIVWPPWLCRR